MKTEREKGIENLMDQNNSLNALSPAIANNNI